MVMDATFAPPVHMTQVERRRLYSTTRDVNTELKTKRTHVSSSLRTIDKQEGCSICTLYTGSTMTKKCWRYTGIMLEWK